MFWKNLSHILSVHLLQLPHHLRTFDIEPEGQVLVLARGEGRRQEAEPLLGDGAADGRDEQQSAALLLGGEGVGAPGRNCGSGHGFFAGGGGGVSCDDAGNGEGAGDGDRLGVSL